MVAIVRLQLANRLAREQLRHVRESIGLRP
jgi:hypothetical protein